MSNLQVQKCPSCGHSNPTETQWCQCGKALIEGASDIDLWDEKDEGSKANFAFALFTIQLIAWFIAALGVVGSSGGGGSDAMGNALASGLPMVLLAAPAFYFIFFTSFYFVVKKGLKPFFRYLAIVNIAATLALHHYYFKTFSIVFFMR